MGGKRLDLVLSDSTLQSLGSVSDVDGETLIGLTRTTGDALIQSLNDLITVQSTILTLGEESNVHSEILNLAQGTSVNLFFYPYNLFSFPLTLLIFLRNTSPVLSHFLTK